MIPALLDVNVLVALFDPAHPNHEDAHRWFGRNRKHAWATCAVTINGCIRVLSSPSYPTVDATPAEAASRLRVLCGASEHRFWRESVSLLDGGLFRLEAVTGHRQVTDMYLLGMAVRHGGRLATFDRSIPLKAVRGARAEHLEILGGAD